MVKIQADEEREYGHLLNVSEVAKRLGVSRSLVYQLVNSGYLPVVRLRRALRFRPEDVEAVEGRRRAAAEVPKGSQIKGDS